MLLSFEGDSGAAIADIEKAKRLNSSFPDWHNWSLALAYFQARNYMAAITWIMTMSDLPNEAYLMLAISRAKMGEPLAHDDIIINLSAKDRGWTLNHLVRMPFARKEDEAR